MGDERVCSACGFSPKTCISVEEMFAINPQWVYQICPECKRSNVERTDELVKRHEAITRSRVILSCWEEMGIDEVETSVAGDEIRCPECRKIEAYERFVNGFPCLVCPCCGMERRLVDAKKTTVGDEIRDANVVRLWRDLLTKRWFGLLGPGDGRGLVIEESNGCGPAGVLIDLARAAARGGWPFDPTAPGPVIADLGRCDDETEEVTDAEKEAIAKAEREAMTRSDRGEPMKPRAR